MAQRWCLGVARSSYGPLEEFWYVIIETLKQWSQSAILPFGARLCVLLYSKPQEETSVGPMGYLKPH